MKRIGILGGIGPASTLEYYKWLNDGVHSALGAPHTADIVLISLDGKKMQGLRQAGDDDGEGAYFAAEAKKLEQMGADFIVIASNTSHKNVPYIEKSVSIPVVHLADATAKRVKEAGLHKIGLLGTKLTMESDFYISRLKAAFLDVTIPEADDRDFISETIYTELLQSVIRPEVKDCFRRIITDLKAKGVECIVLGCTELTLLDLSNVGVPLFDTTRIHVEEALKLALE